PEPTRSPAVVPTRLFAAEMTPLTAVVLLPTVTAPESTAVLLSQNGLARTKLPSFKTVGAFEPTLSFAEEPTRLFAAEIEPTTPVESLKTVAAPASTAVPLSQPESKKRRLPLPN